MKTKVRKSVKIQKPEQLVNNAPRTFDDATFPIGTVAHQGDVIFVRIAELPKSAKPEKNRQLAIGNTQGARHVLASGPKLFRCDAAEVIAEIKSVCPKSQIENERYIGPVFVVVDNDTATVEHPEHGWHSFAMPCVIAVVYQRSLDAEEREQRVID